MQRPHAHVHPELFERESGQAARKLPGQKRVGQGRVLQLCQGTQPSRNEPAQLIAVEFQELQSGDRACARNRAGQPIVPEAQRLQPDEGAQRPRNPATQLVVAEIQPAEVDERTQRAPYRAARSAAALPSARRPAATPPVTKPTSSSRSNGCPARSARRPDAAPRTTPRNRETVSPQGRGPPPRGSSGTLRPSVPSRRRDRSVNGRHARAGSAGAPHLSRAPFQSTTQGAVQAWPRARRSPNISTGTHEAAAHRRPPIHGATLQAPPVLILLPRSSRIIPPHVDPVRPLIYHQPRLFPYAQTAARTSPLRHGSSVVSLSVRLPDCHPSARTRPLNSRNSSAYRLLPPIAKPISISATPRCPSPAPK